MARKWIEPVGHLLFWGLCFWLLYSTFSLESVEITIENGVKREVYTRNSGALYFIGMTLLVKMLLFYSTAFYLLPGIIRSKQWSRGALQLLSLALACFLFEYFTHPFLTGGYFREALGLHLLLYLLFFALAFAHRLAADWWRNERLRARLAEEKLSAELNYLKAQINPHFLFNTLNNLYTLAEREGNEQLSQGLAELSGLMRYVIYEGRADLVSLEREADFLKSMIEMQRLRIDEEDDVLIAFNVKGEYADKKIAPLLLAPLVENAFKHGIRYGESCFIRIDMEVQGGDLFFKVMNSNYNKAGASAEEPVGIGLKNVRRRLALLYPERHTLALDAKGDVFTASLQLQLDG